MLYNAQRKRVRDWQTGDISTCPDCQHTLFARRGERVIWHWAHYASGNGYHQRAATCGHTESAWHLAWKEAYDRLPGWVVEERISGYRADAVNMRTRSLREFIHSLSAYYMAKHRVYASLKFDARWIFDGEMFASERRRKVAKDGIFNLLQPRAYQVYVELSRRGWVHWDGALWKEWGRKNVWFERKDDGAAKLLAAFTGACGNLGVEVEPAGSIRAACPQRHQEWQPEPMMATVLGHGWCASCRELLFISDDFSVCSDCHRLFCSQCPESCEECEPECEPEGELEE